MTNLISSVSQLPDAAKHATNITVIGDLYPILDGKAIEIDVKNVRTERSACQKVCLCVLAFFQALLAIVTFRVIINMPSWDNISYSKSVQKRYVKWISEKEPTAENIADFCRNPLREQHKIDYSTHHTKLQILNDPRGMSSPPRSIPNGIVRTPRSSIGETPNGSLTGTPRGSVGDQDDDTIASLSGSPYGGSSSNKTKQQFWKNERDKFFEEFILDAKAFFMGSPERESEWLLRGLQEACQEATRQWKIISRSQPGCPISLQDACEKALNFYS